MPKPTPTPAEPDDTTGVDDPSLPTLADPEPDQAVGPGPGFTPGDDPTKAPPFQPNRTSDNPTSTVHYYEFAPDLTVKAWEYTDRPDLWNVGAFGADGKARTDIAVLSHGYRYDLDESAKDDLVAELSKLATP